jgi:hypothetical protein
LNSIPEVWKRINIALKLTIRRDKTDPSKKQISKKKLQERPNDRFDSVRPAGRMEESQSCTAASGSRQQAAAEKKESLAWHGFARRDGQGRTPPADLLVVAARRSEDISEHFFRDGEASLQSALVGAPALDSANCRTRKSFYSATYFAAPTRGRKNVFGAVY